MLGGARFGRFDIRVRLILVLLLLFLGVLDLLNIFLLGQARSSLERVERDRTTIRAREVATGLGLDRLANLSGADGGMATLTPTALRRTGVRLGFQRIALLDPEGLEVLASGPAIAAPGGAVLDPVVREILAAGRATTADPDPSSGGDDTRITAFVPALDRSGRLVAILQATTSAPELGRLTARYRTVLAVQIAGVVLIATTVLLFANWVSRPYRRLAAMAGEAGIEGRPLEGASDPDELADAFRGVVEKLRSQEETLTTVEQEGSGMGDVVRFANKAAVEMATGVMVVDARARVAAVNPSAAKLLGVARESTLGLTVDEAVERVDGLASRIRECLEQGRVRSREVLELRDAHGNPGHLGVSISPAGGFGERVAGVLVLMTDLTEIRRLQEHARLRDDLAAVGKLSAGIAHEFRNALGTILGYARILEKNDDPGVRVSAEEIVREVDSVRAAVDEFLLYARPPEPARRRVSMEEVLRGCAGTVTDSMEVAVEGEFGDVCGDEGLLRRAFSNLLRNAADAERDPPGRVRVRITGRLAASGNALQIDVEDDGPGIPPEQRDQVFVPFFTTRTRGTGLGLALVQRTIVDLGGSIEVASGSTLGGACFRIRLPRMTDGQGNPLRSGRNQP